MAADDLLARARAEGSPLLDGDRATFVWEGVAAPHLVGDFNNWGWAPSDEDVRSAPAALERVAPGLWAHTISLPHDAYIEYAYLRGATDDTRVADPLNSRTVWNGGDADNHYFGMPGYRPTPLAERRPGVPAGRVTRHEARGGHLVVGGTRAVHLYRPPVAGPVPLLVAFDGQDYLKRAQLTVIVDNLIAEGRIRPIALALVEHGDQARFVEYACGEATVAFLERAVLPLARAELDLFAPDESPGAFGVLGASMGGLISLYTALRLPHVIGRVLSQSGGFGFDLAGREPFILDYARMRRETSLKIWMDVGRFESLLEPNRRMRAALDGAGYDVSYREYAGGHNYTAWRDDVVAGLEALFGARDGDAR